MTGENFDKQAIDLEQLIIVEQLPKITETLTVISDEIDREIATAMAIEKSEDNLGLIKDTRANLNNIKKNLEERRKFIKNEILQPYEDFMGVYKPLVLDKLDNADVVLKGVADNIQDAKKEKKKNTIGAFAKEYIEFYGLNGIVSVENILPDILLSKSEKSMKEAVKKKLEGIHDDIELIKQEEYAEEIMVEYLKGFDYIHSKLAILDRHREMEKIAEKVQPTEIPSEPVTETLEETISEPTILPTSANWQDNTDIKEKLEETINFEEREECTFTVWVTKNERKRILDLIKEMGVKYE